MRIKSRHTDHYHTNWAVTWHEDYYGVKRTIIPRDYDDTTREWCSENIRLTPDRIAELFVGCLKDGHYPHKDKMADVAHQMHVASNEAWAGEPECDCHNPDSPCPIHTGEPFGEVTS